MSMASPDIEAQQGIVPSELGLLAPGMPEILGSLVNYKSFSVITSADGSLCKISCLGKIASTGGGYRVLEERDISATDAETADRWIAGASQNLIRATQTQFRQFNVVEGVIKGVLHEIERVKDAGEISPKPAL